MPSHLVEHLQGRLNMGHFAKVGADKIVKSVIVAEWDFLDANPHLLQEGEKWVRTSFNTRGGIHIVGDQQPLRKNYAGVGFTYDEGRDAFIPPQPYPSWLLNEETCLWEAPQPIPDNDNMYNWNEEEQAWKLV